MSWIETHELDLEIGNYIKKEFSIRKYWFWKKCVWNEWDFNILLTKSLLYLSESMSLVNELFLTTVALYCMSHIALYFLKLNLKSDCSVGSVCVITLEISQTKLCALHRCDCSSDGILCCILFAFMILHCSWNEMYTDIHANKIKNAP